MSNVSFGHRLPGSLLFPDRLPGEFGLIGSTHITTQHVKVAMAGYGGGLIFGTTCLNQPDRRRGAQTMGNVIALPDPLERAFDFLVETL